LRCVVLDRTKQPKTDQEQKALERQIVDRVNSNVKRVMDRLTLCSPALPPGAAPPGSAAQQQQQQQHGLALDHKVQQLVDHATRPEKVAMMNPTWMPWL
jgi:hypothetical protein